MELTYVNVGLISKLLVFSILGFAAVSSRAWLERTLLTFTVYHWYCNVQLVCQSFSSISWTKSLGVLSHTVCASTSEG